MLLLQLNSPLTSFPEMRVHTAHPWQKRWHSQRELWGKILGWPETEPFCERNKDEFQHEENEGTDQKLDAFFALTRSKRELSARASVGLHAPPLRLQTQWTDSRREPHRETAQTLLTWRRKETYKSDLMQTKNKVNVYPYTIQTPAAMFKGFTVTQFQTPIVAHAITHRERFYRYYIL